MSTATITPISIANASDSMEMRTQPLTGKERIIKLVQALALTILFAGTALLFPSVRQMFCEFWTGKSIVINPVDKPAQQTKIEEIKPFDINIDFDAINSETDQLTFNYTNPHSRFSDVECPSETALRIGNIPIHANRVSMPDGNTYIASQAPVFPDFGLFWQAAFENEGFIVDLTTLRDNIDPYAPTDNRLFHESGTVQHVSTEKLLEHFTLYTYTVKIGEKAREVQRLHFDAWKDYDVTDMDTLNRLVEIINEKMENSKTPIIHCRAGVGRSGTLISVLTLRNLQKKGRITRNNVDETIKEVVLTGRQCRGPAFVQTREQFNTVKASVTT